MPSDPPALSGVEGPWSEKRRLHPWSLLFLLAGQLRQFAVPVVIALVLGSWSRETTWQIYAFPVLIPYALFIVVRYLTFNYTFGDGELVIRSGLSRGRRTRRSAGGCSTSGRSRAPQTARRVRPTTRFWRCGPATWPFWA
jgi:hypothetical protein